MRKMRKALSFVLVLALVMGSFSMVFGAGTTSSNAPVLSDVPGLPGEEQINVCHNLGIIEGMPDGTFDPDTLVNRAQFAAMVTRALGIPESALAGYTTTSFKDASGYGWAIPYLAFCQSKGIMIGDGLGNAMPGRTITTNEAMTMILRAIGYVETSDKLVGTWPSNYVSLAQSQQLYDDIIGNEVYIDRQNAAIALYNAITAQLVSVDLEGVTHLRTTNEYYVADGVRFYFPASLANAGLGCDVNTEWVTPSWYGNSLINITDKVGAWGLVFVNKDDLLVAFKAETVFLTGELTSTGKFEATDGKTYAFASTNSVPVRQFWNGDWVPGGVGLSDWTATDAAIAGDNGIINSFINYTGGAASDDDTDGKGIVTLAADVTGSTIKTIYSMIGWAANMTAKITAGEITAITNDQTLLTKDFILDDDQAIDLKQFSLVGAASLEAIAADNVVYVYANDDDEIRKVAVGTEVVEGVIDESNEDFFLVNGTEYPYAADYLAICGADATAIEDVASEAGADVVAALDAYGNGYEIDVTGGQIATFGTTVAFSGDAARGDVLRLYTSDDSERTFSFVKRSSIDYYGARAYTRTGSTYNKRGSAVAFNQSEADDANILYGYKLNADGYINLLERAVASNTIDVRSRTVVRIDNRDAIIDSNAVIFGNDFESVYTIDGINLSDAREAGPQVGQYILNTKGDKVIAMVLPTAVLDADSDDVYAVINTITNLVSDAQSYRGYMDGTAGTIRSKTDFDDMINSGTFDDVVSLWMLTLNADGNVKGTQDLVRQDAITDKNPDRFITNAVRGAQVVERAPGNTSYSLIQLASGSALDMVPVDTANVVVYKAEVSTSGVVSYTKATAGTTGVSSISGNAWIWAFNTAESADDVTEEATAIIWMTDEHHGRLLP